MMMQERGSGRREDGGDRRMIGGKQAPPADLQHPQKCPRCDSFNTKFCYYNNYSLSQPRYYCKSCRRYWTHGGTLRNVPVGGGSRKGKRPKTTSLSPLMTMLSPSPPPPPVVRQSYYNGGGGGGGGGCGYMSLFGGGTGVGGGYARAPTNTQLINGFDYAADPSFGSYQQPPNHHLYQHQHQQQNQFLQQQPAPVFYPSEQERMNMIQPPMGNRVSQQGGGNRFVMNNYNHNNNAGVSSSTDNDIIWNNNNGAGAARNTGCGDQWRHDNLPGYGGAPSQ